MLFLLFFFYLLLIKEFFFFWLAVISSVKKLSESKRFKIAKGFIYYCYYYFLIINKGINPSLFQRISKANLEYFANQSH